jgi:hypothetical protein
MAVDWRQGGTLIFENEGASEVLQGVLKETLVGREDVIGDGVMNVERRIIHSTLKYKMVPAVLFITTFLTEETSQCNVRCFLIKLRPGGFVLYNSCELRGNVKLQSLRMGLWEVICSSSPRIRTLIWTKRFQKQTLFTAWTTFVPIGEKLPDSASERIFKSAVGGHWQRRKTCCTQSYQIR